MKPSLFKDQTYLLGVSVSVSVFPVSGFFFSGCCAHDSAPNQPLPESLNLTVSNLALNLATKTETEKRWELGISCVGKELSEEEDWDTWKDDTETGEEPVLKKNSLDVATAAAAEDDVFGFPAQPPSVHESCSRIVKRGILSSPIPPPHTLPEIFCNRKAERLLRWRCLVGGLLPQARAAQESKADSSVLFCLVFFGKILNFGKIGKFSFFNKVHR